MTQARLSPREYEILAAYVEYENQPVTAQELGVSLQTVKNTLSSAYAKLDTTNILGALKALGWLGRPR